MLCNRYDRDEEENAVNSKLKQLKNKKVINIWFESHIIKINKVIIKSEVKEKN